MAVRNWEVWVGFTLTFRLSASGDVMVIMEKLCAGLSSNCRVRMSQAMAAVEEAIIAVIVVDLIA